MAGYAKKWFSQIGIYGAVALVGLLIGEISVAYLDGSTAVIGGFVAGFITPMAAMAGR